MQELQKEYHQGQPRASGARFLQPFQKSLVTVKYYSTENWPLIALDVAKALAIYRTENPQNPENRGKIGKI